jgi:hypothetical protein
MKLLRRKKKNTKKKQQDFSRREREYLRDKIGSVNHIDVGILLQLLAAALCCWFSFCKTLGAWVCSVY